VPPLLRLVEFNYFTSAAGQLHFRSALISRSCDNRRAEKRLFFRTPLTQTLGKSRLQSAIALVHQRKRQQPALPIELLTA
jgi:hypothetical protein